MSKHELPNEIQEIIAETEAMQRKAQHEEFLEIQEEIKKQKGGWDVLKHDLINYFDSSKSYELTGYRPIDSTHGLDFDPAWFTQAREVYLRTGHYTQYGRNTKAYADFWDQEYYRCQDGMTVNGYTITGDHYFFLNYYQLMDLNSAKKAGTARQAAFPSFFVAQYIFFHYVELARRLGMNVCLMKARGVGFSEINASMLANAYNCRKYSRNLIAAHSDKHLDTTLDKIWKALNWLNDNTDGGFFKLRQASDTQRLKRASYYKIIDGQKIEDGWMSQIQGIVADEPSKLRGERVDLLIFEEAGSWPGLKKAYIQGQALLSIQGSKFGCAILGGTGGDKGTSLEGLRDIYYDPEAYEVLPYRHNFTANGEYIKSGFFIPANSLVNTPDYMDSRGYTDPSKGKKYFDAFRAKMAKSPKDLLIYSAEYCYTAEEAFSQEGQNQFDQTIIAEQLTSIKVTKQCPTIQTGNLSYIYLTGKERSLSTVAGYKWEINPGGKIHILEHPIWTSEYQAQQEELRKAAERLGQNYEPSVYTSELNNLYVAGIDSIDIGMEETSDNTDNPSKFAIIILKRQFGVQDPVPVAYYMDRPDHVRDAYKIAMCLVNYYQAIVNIEATRMNLYAWAKEKGYYKYFMLRPRATYPDPNKIGKRTPGTPATPTIISHQLQLIENFIEDYGHHIWFEALLDELHRYSIEQKTHFDLVAAFGMAVLADEELGGIVATKVIKYDSRDELLNLGYYYDDNGVKHFGTIPDRRVQQIVSLDGGDRSARTSDPRTWYN